MKKILFVSFPLSGHVNPQINLCKELSKKNVKLVYYAFENLFHKFEGIENIDLRKYPDSIKTRFDEVANDTRIHNKLLPLLYIFYDLTEKILPFIMDEVNKEKPDLIICDPFALWGKAVSKYYNIPYALFFSSIMGDSIVMQNNPYLRLNIFKSILIDFPSIFKINSSKNKIEKKYGKIIDKIADIMSHQNKFSMVMTSKEFHPGGNEYKNNVKFIGATYIDDTCEPDNKDTIFISLGTISFREGFFDTCIEASKDLGYNVNITLAGNRNHKINVKNLPPNVKIYDNLNFEEYKNVLKRSILLISHGGFNSITEAITYNTPLLICPNSPEQINNGRLVHKYACGSLYMPKKIKLEELRQKIINIINDESIKIGVEKYRQSFLNSMGYEKVVDELNKEFNLFQRGKNYV